VSKARCHSAVTIASSQIREPGWQPAPLPQRLTDFSALGQHATDADRSIAGFSDLQELGTELGTALCLQPVMNCGERVNPMRWRSPQSRSIFRHERDLAGNGAS